jgi:anti-anti-sigma factor
MTFTPFTLIVETEEDTCRLRLSGELDASHTREVMDAVNRCAGTTLIIDTTKLTFIDSQGLSTLVEARHRFGPDNTVLIPGSFTLRLLELTRTASLFGLDTDPATTGL